MAVVGVDIGVVLDSGVLKQQNLVQMWNRGCEGGFERCYWWWWCLVVGG